MFHDLDDIFIDKTHRADASDQIGDRLIGERAKDVFIGEMLEEGVEERVGMGKSFLGFPHVMRV